MTATDSAARTEEALAATVASAEGDACCVAPAQPDRTAAPKRQSNPRRQPILTDPRTGKACLMAADGDMLREREEPVHCRLTRAEDGDVPVVRTQPQL